MCVSNQHSMEQVWLKSFWSVAILAPVILAQVILAQVSKPSDQSCNLSPISNMATFSAEQLNQMGAMMQKVVTENNNTLNANWEGQMKVIQEGTTQQLATMRQSTMIDVEKLVKENLQEFAKGRKHICRLQR